MNQKEFNRKFTIIALFFICFSGTFAVSYGNAESFALVKLNSGDESYIERFLHPLPQDLRFHGDAYRFALNECSVDFTPTTGLEEQIVDDFKRRWARRFRIPLKDSPGRLVIKAAIDRTGSSDSALRHNIPIDLKYLAQRPNAKQAYAVRTVQKDKGRVEVHVAANAVQGLYYGLLTLDQLVTPLSKGETLGLPSIDIVDWPDVRLRGTWTLLRHVGSDGPALSAYDKLLHRFSRYKLNLAEAWHINVPEAEDRGPISAAWVFPQAVIGMGKRYAVQVVPGTGHLPKKFKSEALRKRFPGAPGIQQKKERKTLHLCQSDPDTREFYTQYLTSIAKQYDLADIWMSEIEGPRGVCHCPECKGDTRSAFVKETRNLMYAYKEAKKVNPDFRMILGLTQGAYPHHFSMLDHIPKDVVLNFYNGKMTYKAYFQTYNLPPSVMEFQRLGYAVGSTPSPINTYLQIPFQTPQFCRLLSGEAEHRNLDFMLAHFWPDPFVHDFNAQAMAEFLWNSSGRSAEEFTVAWAARKGWENPEEAAAIILMLEYVARGIHNCRIKYIVKKIAAYVQGGNWIRRVYHFMKTFEDWPGRTVFDKFEYATHHEMKRIRVLCAKAVERATDLKNAELLAGAKLLRHWAIILEQYSLCLETSDPETKKVAIDHIKAEFTALPDTHARWLEFKSLSDYAKRHIDGWFKGLQRQWEPILVDN